MTTAVMHQSALYDFGEIFLKNQSAARNTMNHLNNNNSQTQHILQQNVGSTTLTNNNNFNNNSSLQQQISNQKLVRWSQEQNKMALSTTQLHQALFRANSTPQGQITTLMNTLIENLGHKKLERTQSEPMPHMLKAQAQAQAQAALAAQINTSRYKTELCRPFEEAGTCKYGDKCQFAHGILELRNLQRHPKYKTELCRTFHSVGFCPYGPRCHFVHNAEEARAHNRSVAAYHAAQAAAAAAQAAQNRPAPLSLSPTFSMSTGSDRTSTPGSLSQSPTTSLASFFGTEQDIQQHHLELQSPTLLALNYPHSPTYSAAPSSFAFSQDYASVKCSPPASPPAPLSPRDSPQPSLCEESRLPVFNRLSSTIAAFQDIMI